MIIGKYDFDDFYKTEKLKDYQYFNYNIMYWHDYNDNLEYLIERVYTSELDIVVSEIDNQFPDSGIIIYHKAGQKNTSYFMILRKISDILFYKEKWNKIKAFT